jgi:hypothetical protein
MSEKPKVKNRRGDCAACVAKKWARQAPHGIVESIELVARAVVDTAGGERVRHESQGSERGTGDPDRAG